MSELLHQFTVGGLTNRVDTGELLTVVDTRLPESFKSRHIGSVVSVPSHLISGFGGDWDWDRVDDLVRGGSVVVICGKGLSLTSLGPGLTERGYGNVKVVKGDMEDWSRLYEVVGLDTSDGSLFITQARCRAKGCLGCVVGSRSAHETVIMDATQQIYELEFVTIDAGMMVVGVLDMYVHTNHVSGGWTLASRLDMPYYLGTGTTDRDMIHESTVLDDDETLAVGDYDIEAIRAPGHTPNTTNYLVDGRLLLTGDTLFVKSVGRMEFQFGDSGTATGAESFYEALHDMLLLLPNETHVLPGRAPVGADGRYGIAVPDESVGVSLGDLCEGLNSLPMDVSAFVARVTEDTPEKPANYERVIDINTGRASVGGKEEATELELGSNNYTA